MILDRWTEADGFTPRPIVYALLAGGLGVSIALLVVAVVIAP